MYFKKVDNIHGWINETNTSLILLRSQTTTTQAPNNKAHTDHHQRLSSEIQQQHRDHHHHDGCVVAPPTTVTESLPAPMRSAGTRRSKPFLAMIFAEGQKEAFSAATAAQVKAAEDDDVEMGEVSVPTADELLLEDLLSPRHQEDAFIAAQSKKIGDPQKHVEALYLQYESQFNALVPRVVRVLTAMAEQGVSISARVLEDQLFKEKLTTTAFNPYKKANIEALRQQLNSSDKGRSAYSQPGFQSFETLPSQVCFDIAPYVSFLATVGGVSPVSFLGGFVLLDRLLEKYDTFFVTHLNALKLFLTSVRIASKVLEISVTSHKTYCHAARSSTLAMTVMEAEMLTLLDWNVSISRDDLQCYVDAFCFCHGRSRQQMLSISGGYIAVESDSTQPDSQRDTGDDQHADNEEADEAFEVSTNNATSPSLGSSRPSFVRRLREAVSAE